jgi:flagellar capping protein FliD
MTDNTSTSPVQSKVYQLCLELDDMKKRKKSFVKAYNEEIKRINDEIKDLLNPEEAVELP